MRFRLKIGKHFFKHTTVPVDLTFSWDSSRAAAETWGEKKKDFY